MRGRRRQPGRGTNPGPFAVLGLPARPDLTDDEVRAAWRRIAATAHPDRDDGGDPPLFAAAAAAYATLRTSYDRGEALADMRAAEHSGYFTTRRPGWGIEWRPLALIARLLVAGAVSAACVLAAGWSPGSAAVIAGAVTWYAVTATPKGRRAGTRTGTRTRTRTRTGTGTGSRSRSRKSRAPAPSQD